MMCVRKDHTMMKLRCMIGLLLITASVAPGASAAPIVHAEIVEPVIAPATNAGGNQKRAPSECRFSFQRFSHHSGGAKALAAIPR
jgi:hypothetical protein